MSTIDMDEVRTWAHEAGAIARRYFNIAVARQKPDRSLVSEADIEVEKYLTAQIRARYPNHGLMGEELGSAALERELVWAIDPIDGTGVFLAGLPTWGISIGLLRAGEPFLGLIAMPISGDVYWCDESGAAYWNGNSIRVSDKSSIGSNDWLAVPSRVHTQYKINFPGKTRSLGSIAIHLACVARGNALGSLQGGEGGGYIWDIAAGLAILYAAGGTAVTLAGTALDTRPMLHGANDDAPWLAVPPHLATTIAETIIPLT